MIEDRVIVRVVEEDTACWEPKNDDIFTRVLVGLEVDVSATEQVGEPVAAGGSAGTVTVHGIEPTVNSYW